MAVLKNGSNYAWDLPTVIEREFGFRPGNITPYRVLYRLEDQGLVKSAVAERRRVYHITDKGKKELEKAKGYYESILLKID